MSLQLVFLTSGGFYFCTNDRVYWTEELDDGLKSILAGKAYNKPPITQVLNLETLCLRKGKPASFIRYRDHAGRVQTRVGLRHSHPALAAWIGRHPHETNSACVCLGPDGHYFARCDNGKYDWSKNMDGEMSKLMTSKGKWQPERTPDRVLFGIDGSYLITCLGGQYLAVSSNFQEHYTTLFAEIVKYFPFGKDPLYGYKYITINPYIRDQWLVVWDDNTVAYNLPPRFCGAMNGVAPWLQGNAPPPPYRPTSGVSSPSNTPSSPFGRPATTSPPPQPPLQYSIPPQPTMYVQPSPYSPVMYTTAPLQAGGPQRSDFHEFMDILKTANKVYGTLSGNGGGGGGGSGLMNMINGGNPMGGSSMGNTPFPGVNSMGFGLGAGMFGGWGGWGC